MIRRDLLQLVTVTAIVLPLILPGFLKIRPLVAAEADERVRFRWRVPVAHLETVQRSLVFDGSIDREKDTKGAWVFIFVGVVLLPYLAKSILELMRQVEHGGIIIDACGLEVDIETDKRIPYGMVIVRGCKDIEIRVYRDEIEGPSQLADYVKEVSGIR